MGPIVRRCGYWLLWGAAAFAFSASAQVRVKGYTRKDGTYVAPHNRSAPNSSRLDNYSTQGNYNPYTGKRGTQNPYPTPSAYSTANPSYPAPSAFVPGPIASTSYQAEAVYLQQKIAADSASGQAELLTLVNEVNDGTRSLKSLSAEEYVLYQQLTAPRSSVGPVFHGSACSDDCSGHEAGYQWAEDNGIDDPDDCGGNSASFIEGCRAWAEQAQTDEETTDRSGDE